MKLLPGLTFLLIILLGVYVMPQQQKGSYQLPLRLKVELAGNFGEVRRNHFHLGVDFRTNGQENIPVYSVENGYISRIQVSDKGYGNAVFINHPNGTTSVYAHLNRLNDELANYLLDKQYSSKTWKQQIKVPVNLFKVRKGDLIAYSGNTGSSEGPHLHFELRDTKTDRCINPLNNGFDIKDDVSPVIQRIYWFDRRYSVYRTSGEQLFTGEQNSDQVYKIGSPLVSFGVEAIDKERPSRFKLGIYKAEIYMDDQLMHRFSLDGMTDEESRYVNASIDYEKMVRSKAHIQYLFRLPGNRLPEYNKSSDKGILNIGDGKLHRVRITVSDLAGQTSTVSFRVQMGTSISTPIRPKGYKNVLPDKSATMHSKNATVSFQANSFYDTVPFLLKEEQKAGNSAASPLIHLHHTRVPVHKNYSVSIQSSLPEKSDLRKRTVMQFHTSSGRHTIAGVWKANRMTGQFNELGTVQLVTDIVPPVVSFQQKEPLDISSKSAALVVTCSDNLGTIAHFKGELNGNWILFEKKGNKFTYRPDKYCKPGKHSLRVTIRDVAGNTTSRQFSFTAIK